MSILRSGLAALAGVVVILATGCGSQTPPPSPSGSSVPSSPPAVTSPAPSASVTNPPSVDGSPDSDIFAPERQPALPGIYVPAGFLAQGTDHFALIQAPFDCPTLTDVLGAGQWTVVDRGQLEIPTADPAQPTPAAPMPEMTLPEWLLLRWADEYALVRVGGDENGCLAQVWRLARGEYVAHGAIESMGEASALQVMCAVGSGMAQIGALYFGADGTFFSFQTTVPLEVGSHSLAQETELTAGRQGPSVEQVFEVLYSGAPNVEEPEMPGIESYFPADFGASGWPGSIVVTSVDPLIGVVSLEGLSNEAGELLTLSMGFRCDLPSRQLARAAEQAANATPSPVPSPSPAPGQITVVIDSGPHVGTHEVESGDLTCSLNALGEGWLISYSAAEPTAGELQTLTLMLPESGGEANATMFFGDDVERDWFNTDSAQAQVDDQGSRVEFVITGHDAGSDFTINFTCYDIARF